MKKILLLLATIVIAGVAEAKTIAESLAGRLPEEYYAEGKLDLRNQEIDEWSGLHIILENFPNLHTLDLSGNKLNHVPNAIGFLMEKNGIKIVNLANNKIRRISDHVITLGYSIQWLILTGNPLTKRMQQKLAAMREEDGARAAKHIVS
jgi:hypothetical protein